MQFVVTVGEQDVWGGISGGRRPRLGRFWKQAAS